ncbi:MAG TPA: hypothetical protein VLX90_23035 [Steroidobacteraceae bacterium]|nr:hypothetical protein [Steroidobacteraceae bacterium]
MSSRSLVASLALMLASVTVGFAAEPPSTAAAGPSKEAREKMAAFHEQLAACLRSDKPIAECHKQAMQHHKDMMGMMGKEGCTMTDMDHTLPNPSGKTDAPK